MAQSTKHEKTKGNKSKTPNRRTAPHGPKTKAKAKAKRFTPKRTIRIKYEDIGLPPSDSGRVAQHWYGESLIPAYATLRSGPINLPASYAYWDHAFLMDYYGLKGWEFGNWTSQADRFNYVSATGIALFDLCKILGFRTTDIGLAQKVTLAIGARGKSGASAHFEPHTYAINLTRYKTDSPSKFRKAVPKEVRFQLEGGVGALAHEYGHALDYFFGQFMDHHPQQFALSDGRSIRRKVDEKILSGSGPRADMEALLKLIIWEDYEAKKPTRYYQQIVTFLKNNEIKSTYYIRRNELFARIFEQYIGYKLKEKGMENAFLHSRKYGGIFYAPPTLLKSAVPLIDRMVRKMKTFIRKNT